MARGKHGVFVCIEGIDASGKTTQARLLVKSLRRGGFDVVYTTEPSRGEVGRFIRRYVLQRKKRVPIVVEALLFAVDRDEHVENVIKPALEKGKIVVCDRYVYSSLAYQGAAGLDQTWIGQINRLALTPDLSLLIDVPPEVVLKRMKRKRSVMETLRNQRRVRDIYMGMVKQGRLVRVDGTQTVEQVASNVLTLVLRKIEVRTEVKGCADASESTVSAV